MPRFIILFLALAWSTALFRCDVQSDPWEIQEDSTTYILARDVGSIPQATGRVHVQSFILQGKGHREWSRTEKLNIYLYHTVAFHQWLQRQARRYGVPGVSISYRVEDLTRFKMFGKMTAPTINADNSKTWIEHIARLYDTNSVQQLFRQLQAAKNGRNIALMLYFPPGEIFSFATRRLGDNRAPEWAVIYHQDPYVLAHEFLHLAGADDLYDKRIPPTFCPGDIFHQYTGIPGVCALTAFSIGWIHQLPDADGLTVKDFSSREDKRRRNRHE